MRIARAILTHRPELIPSIKEFYLDSGRTQNLIIAYNQVSVDPLKFEQGENFKLFPYLGKGAQGSVIGQMFLVWAKLAKAFPEVDLWVVHDYDVLVKPNDQALAEKVKPGEYGMVGKPFHYSQKTIDSGSYGDIYPFLKSGLKLSLGNQNYTALETELLKVYPVERNGEKIVLTGYGDFLVAYKQQMGLLDSQSLSNLENGGSEQVPHTVFGHFGIQPVDLKQYFSCFISLDNTIYANFKSGYDISHPVKFWPGFAKPKFKLRLKRFLKLLLTDSRYIPWKI